MKSNNILASLTFLAVTALSMIALAGSANAQVEKDCIEYKGDIYCVVETLPSAAISITAGVEPCIFYKEKLYCKVSKVASSVGGYTNHCITLPNGQIVCGFGTSSGNDNGLDCVAGKDGVSKCGRAVLSFKAGPDIVCVTDIDCPTTDSPDPQAGGRSTLVLQALQEFISE